MDILETMNVIMELPVDTIRLVLDAEYADMTGRHSARAILNVRDLYGAYRDVILHSEGYWADHHELLVEDPTWFPAIIPVPELAFSMTVTVTEAVTDGEESGGQPKLKLSEHRFVLNRGDIRTLRDDFLKHVPDGDDYGFYVLTEKGRQEAERILYEDQKT